MSRNDMILEEESTQLSTQHNNSEFISKVTNAVFDKNLRKYTNISCGVAMRGIDA